MSRVFLFLSLAAFFCQCRGSCKESSLQTETVSNLSIINGELADTLPQGISTLMSVYAECVTGYADGYLLMADGERILYDDGVEKDFATMLDNSDPQDMFIMPYDTLSEKPRYLSDAGRSRCEQLFKNMYGNSEAEVQKRLTTVEWFGQKIRFSPVNGCADSLRSVVRELTSHSELLPYVRQASSFYWRKVRGAKRQSAHSYGIAIDINTAYSNYWLWKYCGAKETDRIDYENRIPLELVRIFERHGFIWGGRWYHYDTMHFEFRPELLIKPNW